jgi:xylan 1,4-beta-xylosidase
MSRAWLKGALAAGLLLAFIRAQQPAAPARLEAVFDARAPGRPFPHFWEQMFGSGRAILSLRDSYRRDLRAVREITGFSYVRFHAIFDDETGFYSAGAQGASLNFSYVDQIYDGLIENGVRPFVEMSFMPRDLSDSAHVHAFWYQPLPNPPKSYDAWGEMVYAFARHLVDRYGAEEVGKWYFEVWNEPNIDFWTGEPKQSTYFQLYDAAARAVKRAGPLRVGGPATAQAAWIPAMIAHAESAKVPLDFVSTHVYANDTAGDVLGTQERVSSRGMVWRAVRKVYDEVRRSARPDIPIIWSEYNASYKNEVDVTDAPFMGPWLANTIRECDGLQTMMSYWTFSDVFEEQGVVKKPFYGGFGLMAAGGIPKAAFNDFALLHRLGAERLTSDRNEVPWALATRRQDGTLAIAVWNYAEPEETGHPADFRLAIESGAGLHRVQITIVDRAHGSSLTTWEAMNRPASVSREQLKTLRAGGSMPRPEIRVFNRRSIDLHLEPHALALVELLR